MKWIKRFNESMEPISSGKFSKFERDHKWCKFTEDEIDTIKSNINTSVVLGRKTDIELNNGRYSMVYSDKSFITYYITKYEDEWYTVRGINYEGRESLRICDQFDELILLLKSIK